MATQWPIVHARLVELLPALPGWGHVQPYDGPPVTGDVPTAYVTVGFVLLEDSAGSYEFTRHSDGWGTDESGFVRCELVTSTGGTDLPHVRAQAFALLDALEESIRADQTLGVLPRPATSRLVVDVLPRQDTKGAQQRLAFSVEYTATTA